MEKEVLDRIELFVKPLFSKNDLDAYCISYVESVLCFQLLNDPRMYQQFNGNQMTLSATNCNTLSHNNNLTNNHAMQSPSVNNVHNQLFANVSSELEEGECSELEEGECSD